MSRAGYDREARAAALGRADLHAVSQQIGRTLHDKEPEAKTFRPSFVGPLEGREDRRQRIGSDPDAGVAHLDAEIPAAAVQVTSTEPPEGV